MENEFQKKKTDTRGKNKPAGLILFSSLAILLLFIGELYVMVVMEEPLLEVALVGVAVLVFAYLDISSVIKWIRINEEEQEEQYAGMLKAEKASYLLIRKYFDEIEEQLALMEDKVSDPFQEIVAAQKATAKVTINRNKENTDALMNSNDKLLDIIFGMESKIEEMSGILSGVSQGDSRETNTELVQKQIEMSNQMRELELNLKNEIFQAVSKLSNVSPQVVMAPSQVMPAAQTPPADPAPLGDLDIGDLGSLGDLEDFATLEADVSMGEIAELEPEGAVEPEPSAGLEPLSELGPIDEPEPQVLPDLDLGGEPLPDLGLPEEALPDLGLPEEALPDLDLTEASSPGLDLSEDVLPKTDSTAEPLPDLDAAKEPMPEAASEPQPEAEPEPEPALPPMPDLSDPDRDLSSDELDGLLASIAAEEASLSPKPEPIPEPEPEKKELPPMPDLSDPNRAMSPDEIAALFANLG